MGILIASLATLLFFVWLIGKKWLEYQAYDSPTAAALPITSSLTNSQKQILQKYFKYYNYLPGKSRQLFEFRVARFLSLKKFVPRQMSTVSEEMKVLISASAIMLGFGFPKVFLGHFKYIVVFPDQFFSGAGRRYHKGEVNPRDKAIVLSWKHFVEGFASSEGVNLGIHEMAHALQLENIIENHEFNFMDDQACEEWLAIASKEIQYIQQNTSTFFRRYAATNHAEFFAVAVENFFERPQAFFDWNPGIYKCLSRVLNQDPLILYPTL